MAGRRSGPRGAGPFAFAVVEMRLGDGSPGPGRELRRLNEATRIVVVTGFDSFAFVVVRCGCAIDYLPKPTDPDRVVDACWARRSMTFRGPTDPSASTGSAGNTSSAYRAVRPQRDQDRAAAPHHRRTLQRMLGKRLLVYGEGPTPRSERG